MAKPISRSVAYSAGATALEGVLVYDDAVKTPRPGLVLVPNWMGVSPANVKQAQEIAGQKYVVLVADVYGKDVRPKSADEAGKAAGSLKADRPLLRTRMGKALEALLAQAKSSPLDASKVGAIGFCFGGAGALELARSGAAVAGVVTFHGTLSSPTPADAKAIKGRVLALHGADDPYVNADEVKGFEEEMRKGGVDWTLVKLGGAVHSFTDPDAKAAGQAQYDARAAKRAFQMMDELFAEVFGR
jgi:dienelactone hydrolase